MGLRTSSYFWNQRSGIVPQPHVGQTRVSREAGQLVADDGTISGTYDVNDATRMEWRLVPERE
ncbi:MAG: hypothetical protein ABMA64_36280 [Myxococcota bacterium]